MKRLYLTYAVMISLAAEHVITVVMNAADIALHWWA